MAGLLMGVLGGALQGVGEGMQEQAKMEGLMKREARLAELNHGYRLDEMRVSDGYQTARDNRQNDFQKGLAQDGYAHAEKMAGISLANQMDVARFSDSLAAKRALDSDTRQFDHQRAMAGLNFENQTKRDATSHLNELDKIRAQTEAKAAVADRLRSSTMGLSADDERQRKAIASTYGDDLDGYRKALASSGNPRLAALASGEAPASGPPRAEMSTDDARVWNNVAPLYTDKITGATDTRGLQQHFLDLNRPDLAAIAAGNMSGAGPSRKEAWDRARKEADERAAGFFKSEKEAFPETNGDRSAWVLWRQNQIFTEKPATEQSPPARAGMNPAGQPSAVAQGVAPAAPQDPAQRKVGQIYTAPDGRLVEWTGQGWRPR